MHDVKIISDLWQITFAVCFPFLAQALWANPCLTSASRATSCALYRGSPRSLTGVSRLKLILAHPLHFIVLKTQKKPQKNTTQKTPQKNTLMESEKLVGWFWSNTTCKPAVRNVPSGAPWRHS